MKSRNIHGEWSISFENRILHCVGSGAFNAEASAAFFQEVKNTVLNSENGDSSPWVFLSDLRHWQGSSLDSWEEVDKSIEWMTKHNCVFFALVLENKLQEYAEEKHVTDRSKHQSFFDFEQAYQVCMDKLMEAGR
ncbi:hypothetical protein M9194_04855 [Vibrio sp. S4M6]|uniref:hypothetical protein n=1 Tax=Vibrio sinus TaxID=2946865 RepID=UPI00202A5AED|nr:hypothetical protein [Vibrio sinus]MCL9780767.1 hypothetical protein [Vibrio sinus]